MHIVCASVPGAEVSATVAAGFTVIVPVAVAEGGHVPDVVTV